MLPYSPALSLARPPLVTYATVVLCIVVFFLQLGSGLTGQLVYFPDSWNPVRMITASLAHGGLFHLLFNMIFYLAFAPALELLIGSVVRYISVMLFIAFATHISYSIFTLVSNQPPLPTLGFSGVVFGIIGLSAYLMPRAQIKVFFWYGLAWKTFLIPAWILAVFFIGQNIWDMLTLSNFAGINLVSHVSGGIAGYLYGYLWLKERKEEVREELDQEIEAIRVRQKYGKRREQSWRSAKRIEEQNRQRIKQQEQDRFMSRLYHLVSSHRDSEAVFILLSRYDLKTPTHELEELFDRIGEWGPSRTLLCLGRLIIHQLRLSKRHGRAIAWIERCQQISPQFILPDIRDTLFYAQAALEMGKPTVARNLLTDCTSRYGGMIDFKQCESLLQKAVVSVVSTNPETESFHK